MPQNQSVKPASIGQLFRRSAERVVSAVLLLLQTAVRPTTEFTLRFTAILLICSMALLGLATVAGTQFSTAIAGVLCVLGAVGLLLSGVAGIQLDAPAISPQPNAADVPLIRR